MKKVSADMIGNPPFDGLGHFERQRARNKQSCNHAIIACLLVCVFAYLLACGGKQVEQVQTSVTPTQASQESTAPPAVAKQKPHENLVFPPLNPPQPPQPQRFELDNGMVVYLLEDREFPIIDISAWIRTGAVYEPTDKIGLADITGAVMRTGGTASQTGDELDEILESLAASVEVGIGDEVGEAAMSVLKEDLDTGLSILADVLMNPAFREDKIELAKVQHRSAIARRNDDPADIAAREFMQQIYGADSPYARTTEYLTIESITRDDLVAFHKQYFHPNRVILGAVGDFDAATMKAKIEAAFAAWQPTEIDLPKKPDPPQDFQKQIALVNKSDVDQTNLYIGHMGWLRTNPDYPALAVMSQILGVGFSSRLVKSVRTEKGLAYDIGCNYGAGYDMPGIFIISGGTKSESTMTAIETILEEVEKIRREPVSTGELKDAIDGFLNSSVFAFDTKDEILERTLRYAYYGYPHDFFEQLIARIRNVTAADVQRVAEKYLHPDRFTLLAVGNADNFDRPLDTLGDVAAVDITIPLPSMAEETTSATDEAIAKAQAILARTIEAHGGLENLKAVENLVAKGAVSAAQTPMGPMTMDITQYTIFPDRTRLVLTVPQVGEISYVYNGQAAWLSIAQQTQPLDAVQVDEFRKSTYRDSIILLPELAKGETPVQHTGTATVDGKMVDVIQVTQPSGEPLKLFVDSETGLILKKEYQVIGEEGPAIEEEFTDDYRVLSGVQFGYHIRTHRNGEKFSEIQITEAAVNTEVDASMFEQ